jgi:exonuclease SbcC
LGDHLDADEIDKLVEHASEVVTTLDSRIAALDDEADQNRASIQEMTSAIARLEERIEAQSQAAQAAEHHADLARNEAQQLADMLRPRWDAVLVDLSAYRARQAEIAQLRPLAERDDELHEAPGKLAAADDEIARIDMEAAGIAEVDRVPVPDAEADEHRARQDQFAAAEERAKRNAERDDFVSRRKQADTYTEQVNQLSEQAEVFTVLSGLLSDRGQLQVEIATQEQRRIVDEVNQVLDLLGDPLRVQLGDPRCASTLQQLQDLRIVDTSDPTSTPRYFEFLSGGEKFRIALTLALALHRRVAGGAVGTLVIDEGFGALDSERRDTLALQMTAEAGHGVLGLGLAESIVICSHQSEVQRHFPHRWHVTKRDGAASVTRIDLQMDDLTSVGLLDAGYSL